MKKKILAGVLACVLLVSLGACGSKVEKAEAPKSLIEGEAESGSPASEAGKSYEDLETVAMNDTQYPTADSYNGTLSQGINGFAFNLAEQLNEQDENGNYFFSPYSLSAALTLLNNAASGDTLNQINEMLGIESLEDWNQQLSLLMNREQPENAYLISANSLWLAQDYQPAVTFYDTYSPLVATYFDAALFQADYKSSPELVVAQMNQWISDETEGMISDFVENVEKESVLTLLNAVYFYGEWQHTFEANNTRKHNFTCGDEEEITVEMMNQGNGYLKYLSRDGIHAISMPYGDGSKVMNIIVQNTASNVTAQDIFGEYSAEQKNEFLHTLMTGEAQKITTLSIPKFKMEYTIEGLPELLQKLGMKDAFYYSTAEFPHISPDAFVSDVSHLAKIEVDEMGSEAAAVTSVEVLDGKAASPEATITNFIVDRPFLFFIQDVESEVILFSGQVNSLPLAE